MWTLGQVCTYLTCSTHKNFQNWKPDLTCISDSIEFQSLRKLMGSIRIPLFTFHSFFCSIILDEVKLFSFLDPLVLKACSKRIWELFSIISSPCAALQYIIQNSNILSISYSNWNCNLIIRNFNDKKITIS